MYIIVRRKKQSKINLNTTLTCFHLAHTIMQRIPIMCRSLQTGEGILPWQIPDAVVFASLLWWWGNEAWQIFMADAKVRIRFPLSMKVWRQRKWYTETLMGSSGAEKLAYENFWIYFAFLVVTISAETKRNQSAIE